MSTLSSSEARIPPEVFNRVAYRGERVRVARRGKEAVFIISEEDAALLELIEDRLDIEEARETIRDMKARKQKPIPWDAVKAKLGL